MQTLITIDDYRRPQVFAAEQQVLFHRRWQFAGFSRDLANDGDYIVAEIAGKSVVIQNFAGELKGFLNVCSHRFSAIRGQCKGNGPLQCQYHGWVYDRLGVPVGIANIREFDGVTAVRRQELALESWDVECCGELVFVRGDNTHGLNLRTWLGDAWGVTEQMGMSLGALIDCNRMVIEANWKVAVENTLESYHVKSVHPQTFARLSAKTAEFRHDGPHSSWKANIDAGVGKKLQKLIRLLRINSDVEGYFHQFVFPALTLATTVGMTYAVQCFRPLSARSTEFTSYVFTAKQNGTDAQQELLREACRPAAEFNRAVFEEDRVACGQAQRGIEQARNSMIGELSNEEQRVHSFQCAWKQAMELSADRTA